MSPLFERYLHIIQEKSNSTNLISKALVVALDDDSIDFNQFMAFLNKINKIKIDNHIIYLKQLKTHEVKTKKMAVKASKLIPTQSEIDIDGSIGYVIEHKPDQIFKILKSKNPLAINNKQIITCNDGKYIIDGHHRWSEVLLINPEAELDCLNIDLDSPLKTLKAIQLGIKAKKNKLPTSSVEGHNLLTLSPEEINDWTQKAISKTNVEKRFSKYAFDNWGSNVSFADWVTINSGFIKSAVKQNPLKSQKIPRSIMPQTDDVDWATHIPYPVFDDNMKEDFETESVKKFIRTGEFTGFKN